MTRAQPSGRAAKFARVLPSLRLRDAQVAEGQTIVLEAPGLAERCDILIRLCDASGRTHAQQQTMLEPGQAPIPVAKALNLPHGRYTVWITPPLDQFHGGVAAERKLPVTLGAAQSGASARAAALLDRLAAASGPVASLARLAGGSARPGDDDAVTRALPELGPDFAFAVRCIPSGPAVQAAANDRLERLSHAGAPFSACAAALAQNDDAGLAAALRALPFLPDIAFAPWAVPALVAAAEVQPDRAEAGLDRVLLGLALTADAGHISAPPDHPGDLPALSYLAWETGDPALAGPAALALALSGYETPALIQAAALGAAPRDLRLDATAGTLEFRLGDDGLHLDFN